MTGDRFSRVRWGVRGALALGVATSVTANVLHALPNLISQAIAAWPPLALLLTVELISRIPVHERSLSVVRLAATASIAGIAAWVSYWHMAGVAARYGEIGAAPYLIPLSVDGLVVVASVCLVELSSRIQVATEETVKTADVRADAPADSQPDKTTKPGTRASRKKDTGKAVARLRTRHPELSTGEIARQVGVTARTVRRHLSATTS
ncbi:DUF2637 domain-containing protein [Actinoplanes sp. N902-109]|uniref:DUF2637 domain-containing protein n=1 Tax=Actinoplanes sp. (strain N902-109) TaxID=649831 RepID=UPI0003294D43|nr:DUF2637 domain-containing protein [Actinoplanes sp. N902-109]AGL21472.1 hypothetical protein L083_7962 [Actinoplanes sp. N902-109]